MAALPLDRTRDCLCHYGWSLFRDRDWPDQLSTYATPVSKLAPIWSCNVLVTLAIGAIVLGEAAEVNLVKLIAGAVLIVGGAVLVGNS
jgi:hypothetical protein